MSKYPNIEDRKFYSKINQIYEPYKIPLKKKSFKDICFPKSYKLQLPQKFVAKYIQPNTPYTRLLIYHQIGAGKTCAAIQIAEAWKQTRKIIIVLPASLRGNFYAELRSQCADNNYMTERERKKLAGLNPTDQEYKDIIKLSNQRIDEIYSIYSYNKFVQLLADKELSLNNTLLIIDEIQNMISEEGTYYQILYDAIKKQDLVKAKTSISSNSVSSDLRVVLLSATPIFDKPSEIALTMNLLLPKNRELPIGKEFNKYFINNVNNSKSNRSLLKNIDRFKRACRGYISYFRGAPAYVFPTMSIRYVRCEMSDYQYSAYKDVSKLEEYNADYADEDKTVKNLPNNFFIGTRIVSNLVFPNKQINEKGFASFKGAKVRDNISMYSTKFAIILARIEKARGKIFVYSGFKEYGGIKSFARILEEFGYKNYNEGMGTGSKRFAIWSGDESNNMRDEIRSVYNNKNNLYGKKLKILLGSPSIKEGVSLTAVRQVHILEPYWNQARLDQIIGRASRYCSHKDVPEEERLVKVYVYIAVHPKEPVSVDEYIHNLSSQKNKLVREFEKVIKQAAVDCELNNSANIDEDGNKVKCDTDPKFSLNPFDWI